MQELLSNRIPKLKGLSFATLLFGEHKEIMVH